MRIEGLLVDLDGTLYTNDGPVEGACEALERLDSAGIALRYVTNATHKPRREVAAHLAALGFPAEEDLIFTPAVAASERLRREGISCYPLVVEPLLEDLEGVTLTDDSPDCVLLGNIGRGFTYDRLDAAFRHLMAGAELIALTKNRYWQAAGGGLSLDAGPFVAALEYASGRPSTGVGKPEHAFFQLALEDLGLPSGAVAMVGDDPELDIGGARAAGLRGFLVETGRHRRGETPTIRPDLVLESIGDLPETLEV